MLVFYFHFKIPYFYFKLFYCSEFLKFEFLCNKNIRYNSEIAYY